MRLSVKTYIHDLFMWPKLLHNVMISLKDNLLEREGENVCVCVRAHMCVC